MPASSPSASPQSTVVRKRVRGGLVGEVEHRRAAEIGTMQNVARTGGTHAILHSARRTDHEIGKAVAIDIARARDRPAETAAGGGTQDGDAIGAVEGLDRNDRRDLRVRAVEDVDGTGILAGRATSVQRIGMWRADARDRRSRRR